MNFKELRLDAEALLSQVIYGHGFLHYGYWPQRQAEDMSLHGLGRAQQCYFEKLVETLPADVTSLLDVGSGTGSNAASLIEQGFTVDCVCPSPKLNDMARGKLPASSHIFECRFEDFHADSRYHALLFCESFHYLDAARALSQAALYAERYVLIFDYFRRQDSAGRDRVSHRQFSALLADDFRAEFEVMRDEDVTEFIAPTFQVLDEITNSYFKPFTRQLISDIRTAHPFYSLLFSGPLKKLGRRSTRPSSRHQRFSEQHEYRLILLRRRGGA